MTAKGFLQRLRQSLRGWTRTLLSGAPEGMEHVRTLYHKESLDSDPAKAEDLLAPYERLLDNDRYRATEYQIPETGIGRLYHRDYRISVDTTDSPESIVSAIVNDLNRFTNTTLARFEKSRGAGTGCRKGDRYDIIITGPWNGPVEVADCRPGEFSFVTLKGHLESGFISFGVVRTGASRVQFQIRSWATCADLFVWFSYVVLGLSRYMQTKMWRYFCLKVAKEFGQASGALQVTTYTLARNRDRGFGR
jgi:hypothetical protein